MKVIYKVLIHHKDMITEDIFLFKIMNNLLRTLWLFSSF